LLLQLPFGRGLRGFTSTRVGGASHGAYDSLNLGLNTDDDAQAVKANRRAAFSAALADPARVVYLQQVHQDRILEATAANAGAGSQDWAQGLPGCDAAWTREAKLPLAIGHADCLAVVLADVDAGILGVAHAGWRGALAQLPAKLAQTLISQGVQPNRLQALLSPCLGPQHLELGEEQWRLFQASDALWEAYSSPLRDGHFKLDLWTCARRQLEGAGLSGRQIQGQELDTQAHPELFYSHRRDQGRTGRMLTAAWLE
jgi:YfiH family protein